MPRYFYDIRYSPRDLRLGLVEASENRIGSPSDQVLLYCFHYDPPREVRPGRHELRAPRRRADPPGSRDCFFAVAPWRRSGAVRKACQNEGI